MCWIDLFYCRVWQIGCPPPVEISYRASLVGVGKVIVLGNPSNNHLYNVRVVGRNMQQAYTASVKATDHLPPGGVVEVGFITFGNWKPESGETIEVYAYRYGSPKISIIP